MPELPEVETMKRELQKKVQGRTFLDVWTDTPKLVYHPSSFLAFKREIKNLRIQKVERKGKVLVLYLSQKKVLLVHPKLTGHFILGHWIYKRQKWEPNLPDQYIHLMFWLDNQEMLAWSDLRKFSRIEIQPLQEIEKTPLLKNIGPDPLSVEFSFLKLQQLLGKTQRPIKVVLMDQSLIGGIGNIYANEILWAAKIYPGRKSFLLTREEGKKIYQAMRKILKEAVELEGTSVSDFRGLDNQPGRYLSRLKVYRRVGKPCPRCGHPIEKREMRGRSVYYCPLCQPKSDNENVFSNF